MSATIATPHGSAHGESQSPLRLAVIGAGPRGIGVLERLAANRADMGDHSELVVHLIDPHPAGAGRIWRLDQSPLLKLNSTAEDVTMFTDGSSVIDGPIVPGPSLVEWASQVVSGLHPDVPVVDAALWDELVGLRASSFPTRRLQSLYLSWFYRRSVEQLGDSVTVHEHCATASAVHGAPQASQEVELDDGTRLDVDVVLYALGHNGSEPTDEHRELASFAREHGLRYTAPDFTADADFSSVAPGQRVIVRGFGLAAVDLIVLLGEGRGGRFERNSDGQLDYLPSGLEPRLVIGSGRGVPYRSKIESVLRAERPEPRFFTAEVAGRLAGLEWIHFTEHVWPLIAKEMLWGYYWELFHGHPERVSVPWECFAGVLQRCSWDSPELRGAIDAAVLDRLDRLHLADFDRPLDGRRFASRDDLQVAVSEHIRGDITLRTRPEHSATLGLFYSLLQSMFLLGDLSIAENWSARSRVKELAGEWIRYFSYVASGPPAHRLEEILALSRAGVVEFLGSSLTVWADPSTGAFRARGANSDHTVTAHALIDARLPACTASRSANPALRSLVESGAGAEEVLGDEDFTGTSGKLAVRVDDAGVITGDGTVHTRRFAIGPYTSAPFVGAFARPRTNAVSFRENDRVARAVIRRLAEVGKGCDGDVQVPSKHPSLALAGAPSLPDE
jgi:uncharacterized NAD(P)/FAD-binding protein YdhS